MHHKDDQFSCSQSPHQVPHEEVGTPHKSALSRSEPYGLYKSSYINEMSMNLSFKKAFGLF